jgi:hypothetical protein
LVALIAIIAVINLVGQQKNGLRQIAYREASKFAETIGSSSTLISVRDDQANEWAVFYLSDAPTLIYPYRVYMAQAHVLPFMARSKPVELSSIVYIVTDHDDGIRSSVKGAHIVQESRAYSLWKVDGDDWTVTADGGLVSSSAELANRTSGTIDRTLRQ